MTVDLDVAGRMCRATVREAGVSPDGSPRVRLTLQSMTDNNVISEHLVDVRRTAHGFLLVDVADGRVIDATVLGRGHGQWLVQLPRVDVVAAVDGRRTAAGAGGAAATGEQRVCAPMPGRILKVMAQPGETVVTGQALVVIEAMKMENALTALRGGVVHEVLIVEGHSVETGRLLMRIH